MHFCNTLLSFEQESEQGLAFSLYSFMSWKSGRKRADEKEKSKFETDVDGMPRIGPNDAFKVVSTVSPFEWLRS